MKMNRKIKGLAFAALSLAVIFSSCGTPEYSGEGKLPGQSSSDFTDYSSYKITPADVSSDFMRGVDASEVKALEECGIKFYDDNDCQKDVFKIFAEHGVNWIRLRLWNDYTQALDDEWGPYGYNNLSRTIDMAQRAKKYGMKVLLDFHYSDTWADPSSQKCPAAWSEITDKDELAEAVGVYTKEVLQEMIDADCPPDMVQLGNEMQGGLFASNSSVTNAKSYTADYLKAAAVEVRNLLPDCQIMLHMSNGGKAAYLTTILNYASALGSDSDGNAYVDAIGVSYYSWYKSHGSDSDLKTNLQKIKDSGYKAIIAENSFAYSNDAYTDNVSNTYYQSGTPTGESKTMGVQTALNLASYNKGTGIVDGQIDSSIENQAGIMQYLMELCSSVDEDGGYFYWGTAYLGCDGMSSAWENQALFDADAKALPSLDVFSVE